MTPEQTIRAIVDRVGLPAKVAETDDGYDAGWGTPEQLVAVEVADDGTISVLNIASKRIITWGTPIPGVRVSIAGPDGQPVTDVLGNPVGPATTDINGDYHFGNLPALPAGESYTVTVDQSTIPEGYRKDSSTATTTGDDHVDLPFGSLERELRMERLDDVTVDVAVEFCRDRLGLDQDDAS